MPCKVIDYNIFYVYTYFCLLILFSCKEGHAKNSVACEIQHFNHAFTNVLLPKNFAFSWRKPNYPSCTKAPLCILVSKVYFHKKPDSYGSSFEEFELLLSNIRFWFQFKVQHQNMYIYTYMLNWSTIDQKLKQVNKIFKL